MTSSLPISQPSLRATQKADTDVPMTSVFARTLRTYAEREKLDLAHTSLSLVEEPQKKKGPAPVGRPLTSGILTAKEKEKETKAEAAAEPVKEVEPTKAPAQPLANGLLTRGWAWLKKNNKFAVAKQLRVAETVSLGEKRFVSVIQVDGQKFLIGGGSSGVTLLTQLGAADAAGTALQTIANAGEQLK
jgi:hypothetical protein